MPLRPAQPGLYSTDDVSSPRLFGRRCTACDYVFFPPHAFGCEKCGAPGEETVAVELAGDEGPEAAG